MAGTKGNAKTKSKEDKGKVSKSASSTNDDSEEVDFAILRKPIPTSITGFAQARKIFDLATVELKNLLSNECDLLYECKVCRNMFRSLANFISHKRVYCKEKFNSTVHSEFVKATSTAAEWSKIKHIERGYQEYVRKAPKLVTIKEEDETDRIPVTKDLTDIIERLTKSKGATIQTKDNESQVSLQTIPNSSVAMFQNMKSSAEKYSDKMRAQVRELDEILSRDKAILQSDGKFAIVSSLEVKNSDVIQISDDDDTDEQSLKCKICELQFSTQKTLRFHMKSKHVESRLVYPCPDCLEIFCNSWSVYRHLFKVHRKTAAQIRRLRESIQAKAFKMNNPPAFYEKRKNNMKTAVPQKLTEDERIDQENQAWMDNLELEGEVPRCGGCGRTFERRAALTAHTATCQPRSRALARRPDAKKIEIQIRKDYNKGPAGITIMKATGIQDKPAVDMETQETSSDNNVDNTEQNDVEVDDKDVDTPMDADEPKSDDSADLLNLPPDDCPEFDMKPSINLPYARQEEKSNLAAFKQIINPHIDFSSLLCKKCDAKQKSATELFDHMATHFKWKRYACKLCNFKHYRFDALPEHVKTVHKLKGDSDFYLSTVKAVDGTEAMILSKCMSEAEADEANDQNEMSPESRRPSRCSSDSSRLSDDSSSSSNVKEGARKRKRHLNKGIVKRKKDVNDEDVEKNGDVSNVTINKVIEKVIFGESNTSNEKAFEENSSDVDDIDDKVSKCLNADNNPVSRRPVRNKSKRKNEDFEYDLSNLLKMEAQGYRDSQQTTATKTNPIKKKCTSDSQTQPDNNKQLEYIKHDYLGALAALSRRAVEIAAAHMRTAKTSVITVIKDRSTPVFAMPLLPKGNKISPRKETTSTDDTRENIQNKIPKGTANNVKDVSDEQKMNKKEEQKDENKNKLSNKTDLRSDKAVLLCNEALERKNIDENSQTEPAKYRTPNLNIPAVLPMKIRRQSLEIMKPIINKNITDLSKAGMKTQIVLIKHLKKDKDNTRTLNTPLKIQAIKFKGSIPSNNDQAVLVKVPKVSATNAVTNSDSVASIAETGEPDHNKDEDMAALTVVESPQPENADLCDNHDSLVIEDSLSSAKETVNTSNNTGNDEVSSTHIETEPQP